MPENSEIARLRAVMAALRDPASGCPWDRVQDFSSIAPYTIEEAYEVADAILRSDPVALEEELGDLLLQVVYHARLAEERGWFDLGDVTRTITEKMVRRHPHVFAGAVQGSWEDGKEAERRARGVSGALGGVSAALPALTRAERLTARAARVGFDWKDAAAVLKKLDEEIAEVRAELPEANPARLTEEVGDVLFVVANLARKLGLDAERCLREANFKFENRFRGVEERLACEGKAPGDVGCAEMETHWKEVKAEEKAAKECIAPACPAARQPFRL